MIERRIKDFHSEFLELEDDISRYTFLIELSAYISTSSAALMTNDNLWSGCQSKVWLNVMPYNDTLLIEATSDTMIIRGILYVIISLFQDCTVSEIAASQIDIPEICALKNHFTSKRQSGIASIIGRIQEIAQKEVTKSIS